MSELFTILNPERYRKRVNEQVWSKYNILGLLPRTRATRMPVLTVISEYDSHFFLLVEIDRYGVDVGVHDVSVQGCAGV